MVILWLPPTGVAGAVRLDDQYASEARLGDDELVQARQSPAAGTPCDHRVRLEALLRDRDQTYSLAELASLFNAASDQPQDLRYTRAHWWRFMVLAVGTASREAALRELTWHQIDLRLGRIHLNPDSRRQTKKRGATVPITPTVANELECWTRDGANVMTYYGRAA